MVWMKVFFLVTNVITILLSIVINIHVTQGQTCNGDISQSEYDSMEALFDSTDGKNWHWGAGDPESYWSFPSELSKPCAIPWQGIACLPTNNSLGPACSVLWLHLRGFQLKGPLPMLLNGFANLFDAEFSFNNISGTIPTEIGLLTGMNFLYLDNNIVTGSIPSEIGLMSSLIDVYFNDNELNGTIPVAFGNLTACQLVDISRNAISGTLPLELTNMTNLQNFRAFGNRIEGELPSQFGLLPDLVELALNRNLLKGTIPSELAQISSLESVYLFSNAFTGTIPRVFGNVIRLQSLYLNDNKLNGTIPTELGKCTNLTDLYLNSNYLTGTIPSELGFLFVLKGLYLSSNSLFGSLPSEMQFLAAINDLVLTDNTLSGTLPSWLGSLTTLKGLYIDGNLFEGSLPEELFDLNQVIIWLGEGNYITGTIPSIINGMTSLQEILLSYNYLSGTIPDTFGQPLYLLTQIQFESNYLSGYFPSAIYHLNLLKSLVLLGNFFIGPLPPFDPKTWAHLRLFEISSNGMTGPISESITSMTALTQFSVTNNFITGPLPTSVWQTSTLSVLELESNYLTGSIPTSIGYLRTLKQFDVSNNALTGTLPDELGNCTHLKSLVLAVNMLSGPIPASFSQLADLVMINVSTNMLSGPMGFTANSYGAEQYRNLVSLDISQNALTGTLPPSLFLNKPELVSIIMFSNCFSGSIPSTLCAASNLSVVVMDSLSSASGCQHKFPYPLQEIFRVLLCSHTMKGTIPDCIWSLSSLETLHVAGNALTGTLAELSNALQHSLVDVSIANNHIQGTIPISWQQAPQLQSVDLSSNKLSGTLSPDYVLNPNAMLKLIVNRLSGDIPSQFYAAPDVNILNGNLFQCNENSKPQYDPNSAEYVCGSDNFNQALFLVVSILFCVTIVMIWTATNVIRRLWSDFQEFTTRVRSWQVPIPKLLSIERLMRAASLGGTYLAAAYIAVVLSSYLIIKLSPLKAVFSTHLLQYGWTTSIVYLHDWLPYVLLCLFLSVSIGAMALIFATGGRALLSRSLNRKPLAEAHTFGIASALSSVSMLSTTQKPTSSTKMFSSANLIWWLQSIGALGLIAIHCAAMLGVNVLYVYIVLVGLRDAQLLLIQFILSVFKLTWNSTFVSWVVKRTITSPTNRLISSVFMMLFTFLASPVIATIFSDTTCFRYIVTGEPSVTSEFSAVLIQCQYDCTDNNLCGEICTVSYNEDINTFISVTPSWIYSYQCSSAILINYIPVLLLCQVLSGVVVPLIVLYYSRIPAQRIDSVVPGFIARQFFRKLFLYKVFAIPSEHNWTSEPNWQVSKSVSNINAGISKGVNDDDDDQLVIESMRFDRPLNSVYIVSKLLLNFSVLLTFGLACPLLGFAVVIDSWGYEFVLKMLILRYILLFEARGDPFAACRAIEMSLEHIPRAGLSSAIVMVSVLCSMFWVMFVFDMMGDVYGSRIGYLSIFGLVVGTALSHFFVAWFIAPRTIHDKSNEANEGSSSIIISPDEVNSPW